MSISLSSTEHQAQSKTGQFFQWAREHLILLIVLILLILPFINEAWSFTRVSYLVNQAALKGTRQAATGLYDSCISEDCRSSNELIKNIAIDNARLDSIHRVVYETLGETAGGSSIGQTQVAICSSDAGFYFDPQKNLCFPTDSPGEPRNAVTVSVQKDYVLGSSLGSGSASLPIRAQYSMPVESFHMTRSVNVPAKILVSSGSTNPATTDSSSSNTANASQQLIIVTGKLQLIATDVDKGAEAITLIANANGGYVAQSTSQFDGSKKNFNIQIRIPADKFDTAFQDAKKLGIQVLSEDINRKDVSEEYVDLEGRLRGLQATANRLQEFLEKAKTVDEALKVNTELGTIQQEIEQVTGRKKYLENQSQFATIDIVVSEKSSNPIAPTFSWQPPETVAKAWQFLMGIVYFTGDVLIWAVIVGLPIGLVLWAIWKLLRRTIKRKA